MNGSPHDPHRRGTDRLDDMLSSTDDQQTAEYQFNPHQQTAPQYAPDQGGWGGQPGYPAGGYARPAEYEPQKPRRGAGFWVPIAIILLSLLALAAVWFLTRSGSDDGAASDQKTSSQQDEPSGDSGDPGTATSDPSSPEPSSPTPSPSSPTSSAAATLDPNLVREFCDGATKKVGVPKGNRTSCDFANNVAAQVRSQGAQTSTFTVSAWSPKTEDSITMSCQPGTFVTCTGGVQAVVYVVP